jgi:hypothetical protein
MRTDASLVRLFTGALLLATLGTAAWCCLPPGEPMPRPSGVAGAPTPEDHGAAATTAGGLGGERAAVQTVHGPWAALPGAAFTYRIDDHTRVQLQSAEGGVQPGADLHTRCSLTTTVLARTDDEILVQQQFGDLEFATPDGRAITGDPLQQSFVAAAAEPVFVRLALDGTPRALGFADRLDGDQRNFLRGMLALVTIAAPTAAATTWTATEADPTGDYEARYEVRSAAGADELMLRRTRQRYLAMAGHATPPTHECRGTTEARFVLARGWLEQAHVDEGLTTALSLLDLRAIVQRTATATLTTTDTVVVAIDVDAARRCTTSAVTGRDEVVGAYAAAAETEQWRQRLAGVTFDTLLAELDRAMTADPVDPEAANAVFERLQWLAKLDDRAAAAFGERVRSGELAGDRAAMVVSALGAAGTPVAQHALAAVRGDRTLALDVREAATIATLQIATPVPALVADLCRDADTDFDGRGTALLAFGALAPRAADPLACGRAPLQALLAMETAAAQRGDSETWLLAVGNTGSAVVFEIAGRYLDHTDPVLRAAACTVLRRVETAAALALLSERGLGDASPVVRLEALRTLARRQEPAARAAIERIARTDPDDEVKQRANDLLRGS